MTSHPSTQTGRPRLEAYMPLFSVASLST